MPLPVFSTRVNLSLCALAAAITMPLAAEQYIMYVGTYTGPKSDGIYAYKFDDSTGETQPLGLAARTVNPTFLAIHPNGKFLYAANETDRWKDQKGGYVTSFSIDKASGKLTELNEQSTVGGGPCHLITDSSGKQLLVANYGGGSVASLPLNTDGSIGRHSFFSQHTGSSVNKGRQSEPHAHSVNLSPDSRYAFVADLGTDSIHVYGFSGTKGMTAAIKDLETRIAPGSGPRHFTFSPDGRNAYVINELLSTVTAFSYDAKTGRLKEVNTASTLASQADAKDNSTAEIRIHPNGRFVYGSNRGHDSIAIFSRDTKTGALKLVEVTKTGGKIPRNFNFDPSGKYIFVGGQNSDDIAQFRVDPATGQLTPTGLKLKVGAPVCFRFVSAK